MPLPTPRHLLLALAALLPLGGCATAASTASDGPQLDVFVTAGNRVLVDGMQLEASDAREAVMAFAQEHPGAVVRLCASPASDPGIREALMDETRGAVRSASELLAAGGDARVSLPRNAPPPRIDEDSCH